MIGFGFSAKPRDYLYSILDQVTIHEKLLGRLNIQRVTCWLTTTGTP